MVIFHITFHKGKCWADKIDVNDSRKKTHDETCATPDEAWENYFTAQEQRVKP